MGPGRRHSLTLEALESRILLSVPTSVDLLSDTGISTTDNLTYANNDWASAPQFTVYGTTAGSTVTVYADGTGIGTAAGTGGSTLVTADGIHVLTDGVHSITATETIASVESAHSPALEITVDTVAPPGAVIGDMQAGSDSGVMDWDRITNDATPTFDVLSPWGALEYYRVWDPVTSSWISGLYESATTWTAPTLSEGPHALVWVAVDAAGNENGNPITCGLTIDTIPPDTPAYGAFDLRAASDSGISDSDNVTNDKTPTFDVSQSPYYRMYREGTQISGDYQSGAKFTAPVQPDGEFAFYLWAVDTAGNECATPLGMMVTIDSAAPAAPGAPDLDASSDTGVPDDNITEDMTPLFNVSGTSPGIYFRLYRDGSLASQAPTLGDDGGVYRGGTSEELPEQVAGTYSFTATLVDAAGNESPQSAGLSVQLSTVVLIASHTYPDGVVVSVYDTDPANGMSAPDIAWFPLDYQKRVTDVFVNPGGDVTDGVVKAVKLLGDGAETQDIGIVVEGNAVLKRFLDERTGTPPVGFLVSEGPVGLISMDEGIAGANINGLTTEGGWTLPADIDGDGDTGDDTAIYCGAYVRNIKLDGQAEGDVWIGGVDPRKGTALKSFQNKSGGYHGDFSAAGDVGKFSLGGDFASSLNVLGSLKSLKIKGGNLGGAIDVAGDLGKLDVKEGDFLGTVNVGGTLGKVQVKRGKTGGGWFCAGANVTVGGLLKGAKVSYCETDNDDEDFGIFAGSFGKLTIGDWKLDPDEDLPFQQDDFCVDLL